MHIQFEWDETKRGLNLLKHGLDVADARLVFAQPVLITPDEKHNCDEPRFRAIGMLGKHAVFIVFTPRIEAIRIISMRLANKKERKAYADAYKK